ncbi:hypothetical protein HW555_005474 [Spodoptera exigua]|uniref:Transposase Helix-turn-helix domain-containing protein n=1 Tax=Spodoptera exigua TaxID=7107 RepID=A0A835GJP2_SPOEX|nr:hypothetical protein HW555_005474 [Spodoptera exigua]
MVLSILSVSEEHVELPNEQFLCSSEVVAHSQTQCEFRVLEHRVDVGHNGVFFYEVDVCCPRMDALLISLLLLIILKRRKRRRIQNHRRPIHRRHWVHPILTSRNKNGQHKLLFEELKCYPDKFFKYFRMSVNSFNELLSVLHDDLKHQDTRMRKSISPTERLAITLRYLATGCSFGDFELVYRCGASTARLIESDPWTSCTCIQYAAYNKTRPGRRDWGAARRGGKKPATVAVYAHESNDKTQPQVASALDSRSLWLGRGHSSAQCAPILYKMYEETRPQVVAATSG